MKNKFGFWTLDNSIVNKIQNYNVLSSECSNCFLGQLNMSADFFSKFSKKKKIQEYHQSVKQSGARSQAWCYVEPDLGSNYLYRLISR